MTLERSLVSLLEPSAERQKAGRISRKSAETGNRQRPIMSVMFTLADPGHG